MIFKDDIHQERYEQILARMNNDDPYHKAAAYLIALNDDIFRHAEDVFDFEDDSIRHEGLRCGWQTGTSSRTTRLIFSLWNGCCQDHAAENPEETSCYYTVDSIFCNTNFAPYFYEAVRIRFEMI